MSAGGCADPMTAGTGSGLNPPALLRKPPWLKVRLPGGRVFNRVRHVLEERGLHSICQEARCPNIAECFHDGTATFLILGNICTRHCLYCNVIHGTPPPADETEPERLAGAVGELNLPYVVITSVTRDDLPDGGASLFIATIEKIRERRPGTRVEVLIPDLNGNAEALWRIVQAKPDILNHNIEVVPALFPALRPQGDYGRSLQLLRNAGEMGDIVTKSGFMIGLGETTDEIRQLCEDLAKVRCRRVTIGQYQQPTTAHWPVRKYYAPEEFAALAEAAKSLGFERVDAGPHVRSSYHAAE